MADPRTLNLYLLASGRVIARPARAGISKRLRLAERITRQEADDAQALFVAYKDGGRFIPETIALARDGRGRLPHKTHMTLVAVWRERVRARLATERVSPAMLEAA